MRGIIIASYIERTSCAGLPRFGMKDVKQFDHRRPSLLIPGEEARDRSEVWGRVRNEVGRVTLGQLVVAYARLGEHFDRVCKQRMGDISEITDATPKGPARTSDRSSSSPSQKRSVRPS